MDDLAGAAEDQVAAPRTSATLGRRPARRIIGGASKSIKESIAKRAPGSAGRYAVIARRGPDPFEGIVFAIIRKAAETSDPRLAVLVASLVTAHDAADRAVGAYEAILTCAGKTAGMEAALRHYFGDDPAKGWRCTMSRSDTPTDRPPADIGAECQRGARCAP